MVIKKSVFTLLAGVLLTLVTVASFAVEHVHAYKNPGANPCNPDVGCTIDWALAQAMKYNDWPQEAVDHLKDQVLHGTAESYMIKNGQSFWMTEGQTPETRAYHPKSFAMFDPTRIEPSTLWFYQIGDLTYYLVKVQICGNWAGWVDKRIKLLIDKGNRGMMSPGTIPVVTCLPH